MKSEQLQPVAWVIVLCLLALAVSCAPHQQTIGEDDLIVPLAQDIADLEFFDSEADLTSFLEEHADSGYGYGYPVMESMMMDSATAVPTAVRAASSNAGASTQSATDFSTTNIQVEGVDEADIVKSDGKFLYVLTGQEVVIVDAFPAEQAKVVSRITLNFGATEIFINGDKLVVIGNDWQGFEILDQPTEMTTISRTAGISAELDMAMPPFRQNRQAVRVQVYDVSDRTDPDRIKNVLSSGYYFDSRMIGEHVYLIANENVWWRNPQPVPLPMIAEDDVVSTTPAREIGYFPVPDSSYNYINIVSLDLESIETNKRTYMMGSGQELYVSQDNIYVVYRRYLPYYYAQQKRMEYLLDSLPWGAEIAAGEVDANIPEWQRYENQMEAVQDWVNRQDPESIHDLKDMIKDKMVEIERRVQREMEQTHIQRFAIDDGEISYEGRGGVPGNVLNQFSMDEFDGHFRVATTTGHVSRSGEATSANHIFVLDIDTMKMVGSVEDLAPGERIYSARFMGERAYMVTFKKVDPLFVIDLADPKNPEVLGKLKIPGYSDYLHPYDEDHIIGIGKDTVEAAEGDFAWYQGVKMALFDVSDVDNPREVAKVIIGDRGTQSEALNDHKAFLFSKEKNLLVLPVTLAEIQRDRMVGEPRANAHGDFTFHGAYVYSLTPEDGFELRGRISHLTDDESLIKSGSWYRNNQQSIRRSLYMDDTLYTVSNQFVQAHELDDLSWIRTVEVGDDDPYDRYPYENW